MDMPLQVPLATTDEALALLGIPTDNLISVEIAARSITATHRRVDSEGRFVTAGDQIATVVTKIGIDRT